MAEKITIGAGLLAYRRKKGNLEVFLAHYGGPFFVKKDLGAWSFPKGHVELGEELLTAARREFKEETGFDIPVDAQMIKIGEVSRPGKVVHVWAFEGDYDASKMVSNTSMLEWPPKSGKHIEIPEVDRGEFFTLDVARTKLWSYMVPIIDMFEERVGR